MLAEVVDRDAVRRAVPEERLDQLRQVARGDRDPLEAVRLQLAHDDVEHRPVADRHQRLRQHGGVGAQARAFASREDHRALHGPAQRRRAIATRERLDLRGDHRRGVGPLGVRAGRRALALHPLRDRRGSARAAPAAHAGSFSGAAMPPNSGAIMSATPSAPVDRHGREASMPRIIARGAPSVGLGQKTDTSNAREHVGHLGAGRGDEVRALAERRAPARAAASRSPRSRRGSGARADPPVRGPRRPPRRCASSGESARCSRRRTRPRGCRAAARTLAAALLGEADLLGAQRRSGRRPPWLGSHADLADRASSALARPPSRVAARRRRRGRRAAAAPAQRERAPGPTPPTRPCGAASPGQRDASSCSFL